MGPFGRPVTTVFLVVVILGTGAFFGDLFFSKIIRPMFTAIRELSIGNQNADWFLFCAQTVILALSTFVAYKVGTHYLTRRMRRSDEVYRQFLAALERHEERYPEARIEVVDNVADALKDTEADDEGGKV